MRIPAQTLKLQGGNLCSPKRRIKKHRPTLIQALDKVKDGRQDQGKRHSLVSILWLVFCAISAGCRNLAECIEWTNVRRNKKFLIKTTEFLHGLPHATTISRAFQVCDVESLVEALTVWYRCVFGVPLPGQCASMDGKTMRGVHGDKIISHIFSLITHKNQRILGQVGVKTKENEITACPRLLAQGEIDIYGMIITADALLTQRQIAKDIRSKGADYLFTVKDNQLFLKQIIAAGFTDPGLKKQTFTSQEFNHGREITRTVEISRDFDMDDLRKDWQDIAWLGKVTRKGRRPKKIKTKAGIRSIMKDFYEETYFISSIPNLTAKKAAQIIKGHWSIENRLHWQKDWTYLEDRQTLRKGNAPQVITLFKSLVIGLFHQLGLNEISKTLRSFNKDLKPHQAFLQKAWAFA